MKLITALIDKRTDGITKGNVYQLLHTDPRGQITIVDDMDEAHTLQVGMYVLHKETFEVAPANLESRVVELERLMRDLVVIPFERRPVVAYGGLAS